MLFIWLYIIQFLYSFCFRQTNGNKKPSNTGLTYTVRHYCVKIIF